LATSDTCKKSCFYMVKTLYISCMRLPYVYSPVWDHEWRIALRISVTRLRFCIWDFPSCSSFVGHVRARRLTAAETQHHRRNKHALRDGKSQTQHPRASLCLCVAPFPYSRSQIGPYVVWKSHGPKNVENIIGKPF
jgi:hypothetical protein